MWAERLARPTDRRQQADRRQNLAGQLHDCDSGYFDDETSRLQPLQTPFGSKAL